MPLSPIREITAVEVQPLQTTLALFEETQHPELEQQLDLNFPGADTQYATHAIHPYVAAINPPLARALITHYVPRGETVLDPFCGGGGVLVEAVLNGRRGVGADINPLAALVSRVKTTYLSERQTTPEYVRILQEAFADVAPDVRDVPDLIRYWYADESLKPLRALQNAVSRTTDDGMRRLFQVALSATARDVMLTYRGEIRLRKLEGKDLEKFRPDVFGSFRKRAELAIARASQLPPDGGATVMLDDARRLEGEQEYHTLISSPPYADDTNGVGYFQFSRNMLYWIGIPLDDQKRQREAFLGCGTSKPSPDQSLPSPVLLGVLGVIQQRKQVHYRQALSFYGDYLDALRNVTHLVRERAIIVIGDRVLSRTHINNGHITTDFMVHLGFELEHYYSRELRKKRIANLGGDGGGTSVEHVLVYRRP